jgi:hypothetical protein
MRARDRNVVGDTDTAHPEAQCRLDTYLAGALCETYAKLDVIPGQDSDGGFHNDKDAEYAALDQSCAQERRYDPRYSIRYGARPLCWFHPITREGAGQ